MPSLTLSSTVRIINKNSGLKEKITIRDVISRGSGSAYDGLMMLDEWDELLASFIKEKDQPLMVMKDMIETTAKDVLKYQTRLSELKKQYAIMEKAQGNLQEKSGPYLGTRSRI
jgi:hypothetical protein